MDLRPNRLPPPHPNVQADPSSRSGASLKTWLARTPTRYLGRWRAETPSDVDAFDWPSGNDWDFCGMRDKLVADLTFARLSPSWNPVFSRLCELFGMEQALVNFHTNRPVIEAALAHLDEFYTDFYRNILECCGEHLDIFGLGDDFAGNDGLLISPDLWRELLKPLYAKWLEMAKSRGRYTLMHSCGKVTDVPPDLIDVGLAA